MLCHGKSVWDHHPHFLLIYRKMFNVDVKVFISCRFSWSFCWADGYNIFNIFYWRMRIFLNFITFIILTNSLGSLHFTKFLDLPLSPTYLLQLFNGNIHDRIHILTMYDKFMLKRMSSRLILSNFFFYQDLVLQTLRRLSFWCANSSKVNWSDN